MSDNKDDPKPKPQQNSVKPQLPEEKRGNPGLLNEGIIDSDKGWEPKKEERKDVEKGDGKKDNK